MNVETEETNEGVSDDELEALFEEARRRARRRRLGYLAAGAISLLVAATGYLLIRGDGTKPAADSSSSAGAKDAPTDVLYANVNQRLVSIDTRTGKARDLPIRLGCIPLGLCLSSNGEQLLIGTTGATSVFDPGAPGKPRARQYGKNFETVLPSQEPGRVWVAIPNLATLTRGGPATRFKSIRELNLKNGRVIRAVAAPDGKQPLAVIDENLLVRAGKGDLVLMDPASKRIVKRLPSLPGFNVDLAGRFVGACRRPPCGKYSVVDAQSGSEQSVRPPPHYVFQGQGVISPDGTTVALPVQAAPGYHRTVGLAVADLSSRDSRLVPDSLISSFSDVIVWDSSSERVYYGSRDSSIMSYEIGATKPSVLTRLPHRAGSGLLEMVSLPGQ